MDDKTIAFYDGNAPEVAQRYEEVDSSIVATAMRLKRHGTVLDVGCGSGRDISKLASLGFEVYGVDASKNLIREANRRHPELEGHIVFGALPGGLPFDEQTFDLVICSAVLMHIQPENLPLAMEALAARVGKGGYLLVSVSSNREGLDSHGRDKNERIFFDHDEKTLSELLQDRGLNLVDRTTSPDSLGRDDIIWLTQVFLKEGDSD